MYTARDLWVCTHAIFAGNWKKNSSSLTGCLFVFAQTVYWEQLPLSERKIYLVGKKYRLWLCAVHWRAIDCQLHRSIYKHFIFLYILYYVRQIYAGANNHNAEKAVAISLILKKDNFQFYMWFSFEQAHSDHMCVYFYIGWILHYKERCLHDITQQPRKTKRPKINKKKSSTCTSHTIFNQYCVYHCAVFQYILCI